MALQLSEEERQDDESTLLEELYRRGLQQPLIGEDLYGGDGLLMFWTHKPVAPWQDEAWIASMRRERASAFQRQVLNEFASSSSQFIDMDQWRRCVDPNAVPVLTQKNLPVIAGVDASTKRDTTALAAMTWDDQTGKVKLVNHRIFQPTKAEPLDFERTIEATLLDWRQRYALRAVYYDPYQMAAVAQRLHRAGIRMVEYPQTPANLTAIGSNLYELIKGASLVVYPDEAIHLAISRAICKETPRGLMITKAQGAHKIDIAIAIAMAMAAYGCVERMGVRQQQVCMIPLPDLTKSGAVYAAPNPPSTPGGATYRAQVWQHYLANRSNQPWRAYVGGERSLPGISASKWWGPIGQ